MTLPGAATRYDPEANQGVLTGGLHFICGRNVFTAIENQSTPQGTGHYWTY